MGKKEEVIDLLEKSSYWEDEFIRKYSDESIWILLESLPKSKFRKIKPLFMENIEDSKKHSAMIRDMVSKIRSGKYEL